MYKTTYLILYLSSILLFGGIQGLLVSVSYLIHPFGFDTLEISYISAIIPLSGILGTVFSSYVIRRTMKYKIYIVISQFYSILAMIALMALLELKQLGLAILGAALLGMGLIPLIPNYYELACELVFPVGEESAVGYLIGGINLSAFGHWFLFSAIVLGEEKYQSYIGISVLIICVLVSLIIVTFCVKEKLNRIRIDYVQQ